MRADRDHEARTGKDQFLHDQFRREEAEKEILISTGGNLDFHPWETRIPPMEFTLYKNTHLRIHKRKIPSREMHFSNRKGIQKTTNAI